jgi:uncharacterized membrane protein AbrB (regulator of aidB expression)
MREFGGKTAFVTGEAGGIAGMTVMAADLEAERLAAIRAATDRLAS